MQVVHIELPVLADDDVPHVLDLVTSLEGVLAASAHGATVEILTLNPGIVKELRDELEDRMHAGCIVRA